MKQGAQAGDREFLLFPSTSSPIKPRGKTFTDPTTPSTSTFTSAASSISLATPNNTFKKIGDNDNKLPLKFYQRSPSSSQQLQAGSKDNKIPQKSNLSNLSPIGKDRHTSTDSEIVQFHRDDNGNTIDGNNNSTDTTKEFSTDHKRLHTDAPLTSDTSSEFNPSPITKRARFSSDLCSNDKYPV